MPQPGKRTVDVAARFAGRMGEIWEIVGARFTTRLHFLDPVLT
jgi:hypothetical protein